MAGDAIKLTAMQLWDMNTISSEFLRGYVMVNAVIDADAQKKKSEGLDEEQIGDI